MVVMGWGIWLMVRNPPLPPLPPEYEARLSEFAEAIQELERKLGEALLPVMQNFIRALTPMARLMEKHLPRQPDPNPMPRFRWRRRSNL